MITLNENAKSLYEKNRSEGISSQTSLETDNKVSLTFQNYFSDPKLNEIIAEGLAREIEIHNLSDNSYSRKKISNYLRSMIIFKKR